jgi:hypothetical protein
LQQQMLQVRLVLLLLLKLPLLRLGGSRSGLFVLCT